MKLYASIVLFAALVFGIGWTSHLLVAQMKEADRTQGGSDRDTCDRYGSQGPYLSTVEALALDLNLTEDQLARLEELIECTVAAVERHEGAICQVMADSRDRVQDILTAPQRERLAEVLSERWRSYRERRIQAAVEWGHEKGMSEPTLAAIQTVVAHYESQKEGYFRGLHSQKEWPTPQEKKEALGGFKQECNQRLSEVLAPPELEALWEELSTCHEESSRTSTDADFQP